MAGLRHALLFAKPTDCKGTLKIGHLWVNPKGETFVWYSERFDGNLSRQAQQKISKAGQTLLYDQLYAGHFDITSMSLRSS